MKFKKTLSAALAALMLVGSAAAVSADATVYTAEDFYTCSVPCSIHGVRYNQGYPCGSWCYYDGSYWLEANWNPYLGRYENSIWNTPGYYWVNGVPYCYDTHTPYTPVVIPATTETKAEEIPQSKETGVIYNGTKGSGTLFRKRKPSTTKPAETTKPNVTISGGSLCVQNPGLLGSVYSCVTVPGTYYAYDKVDLSTFFNANTYNMYLYIGDMQTVDAGFKMVSSDSSVVSIYNVAGGKQVLKAVNSGSASVYLYTGGGVPFMKINVSVTAGSVSSGYVDVQPGTWRLEGAGSSTEVTVSDNTAKKDVVLSVDKGNGYITSKDGKYTLTATGNGPIVLKAVSKSNHNIAGYAIVYVGKYVDAIYNGYWTSAGGNITCNYWNPYLWNYDGYKINGWVLTDTGAYLPVIDRVDTYYTKPTGVINVYSDLYDLLYGDCKGDFNTFYNLLWYRYNLNKPSQSFESLYGAFLKDLVEDLTGSYAQQLYPIVIK